MIDLKSFWRIRWVYILINFFSFAWFDEATTRIYWHVATILQIRIFHARDEYRLYIEMKKTNWNSMDVRENHNLTMDSGSMRDDRKYWSHWYFDSRANS